MNIFATNADPTASAIALADQHVIKMCCETAQVLSTALHLRGENMPGLYKPTHRKHPCVVWAAADIANFAWLVEHGRALCAEYTRRFSKTRPGCAPKTHASGAIIERAASVLNHYPKPGAPVTLALAMPDAFKVVAETDGPHVAYQRYLCWKYRMWAGEGKPGRWTRAVPPSWLDLSEPLPVRTNKPSPLPEPDEYEGGDW